MADEMDLGWNEPAPASKAELLAVLSDALNCVRADDSLEGFIAWSVPIPDPVPCGCGGKNESCPACRGSGLADTYDPPELEGAEFALKARYRVGNSMGQGGFSVFTKRRADAG